MEAQPDHQLRMNGGETLRIGVIVVLVVLLTGAAFVGGFLAGSVTGAGISPYRLNVNGTVVPGARGTPDQPSFALFWEVWDLLKNEYYGQLPDDQHMTYGAIRGVIGTLDDKYTAFVEPSVADILRADLAGSFDGIGAVIHINQDNHLEIVRPYPDHPAAQAGVQAGDIIVAIDGKPADGMGIDEAIGMIRGPAGTTVTLTIARKGLDGTLDITVTRARIDIPIVESKMLDNGVAYIALTQFNRGAGDQLRAHLQTLLAQNPKGVIFDLRDDPGGLLDEAVAVADTFLPAGVVVVERSRDGHEQVLRSADGQAGESIPLVVLLNGGSASASEIVAGALRDRDRATLIGDQSFGKGSVQLLHDLSDGSQLRVTVARWFTPDGHAIHGEGLAPDIAVSISADDERAGKDPQLERAIAFILNGK